MRYQIDSDVLIDHLEEFAPATRLLSRLAREGLAVSAITYAETYEGILRAPDPAAAQAKLDALLAGIPVLSFTRETGRHLADLREALRRQGKRTRPRALDLVIAATAIEHGLILVTRNRHDYEDIPGLQLFDPASLP